MEPFREKIHQPKRLHMEKTLDLLTFGVSLQEVEIRHTQSCEPSRILDTTRPAK